MWSRLVAVGSPWLDHTAVAALTGARPEKLRAAQIRKNSHGALEIRIAGAKGIGYERAALAHIHIRR